MSTHATPHAQFVLLLTTLCLATPSLLAANRYVSDDGTYGADIAGAVCYTDIQTALDDCAANDTVWVRDGFVCDTGIAEDDATRGKSRIVISKAGVTLRGESGNWETGPIIRGRHDGNSSNGIGPDAVRCVYSAADRAKIIGFRLLDGATPSTQWGGCFLGSVRASAPQRMENCLCAGGAATYGGGVSDDSITLVGCVISNCLSATYGNGLRGGNAYDTLFILNTGAGGGAYQYAKNSGTVVSNCTFIGNSSSSAGAAVSVSSGNANHRFLDCRFFDNASGGSARAPVYGYGAYTNCVFSGNSAYYGGAVCAYYDSKAKAYVHSSSTFTSCVFTNNCDTTCQGAVGYGVSFYNCSIEGNGGNDSGPLYGCDAYNTLIANNVSKKHGGGFYANGDNVLVNCTITGNASQSGATAYVPPGSSLTLVNTILAGNSATEADNPTSATNCFLSVSGVAGAGNLVGDDPMLHSAHTSKPLRPKMSSPCRDGGLSLGWMSIAGDSRSRDLAGQPILSANDAAPIGCYNAVALGGLRIMAR